MSGKKKEPGFDVRLSELQRIVARLEAEDLPLEEGVALFKDGVVLAKSCRRQLETARNEVMVLSQGLLEPFEQADGTVDQESAFSETKDEGIPF
ncbi:exodeoxyribonuclease VII small subunit [Desulfonatronum parangueonense]